MKRRAVKKKWNREVKQLKLKLKYNKECSHNRTFLTWHALEGNNHWADIYFIGTYNGRPRLFNCTIMSSADYYEDVLVHNIVATEMDKLYPNRYDNTSFEFKECGNDLHEMELVVHDEALNEEMDLKEKEILKEVHTRKLPIRAYTQTVPDYQYGVGLDIVTEEKMISKEIILDYVKRVQKIDMADEKVYLSDNEVLCTVKDFTGSIKGEIMKF